MDFLNNIHETAKSIFKDSRVQILVNVAVVSGGVLILVKSYMKHARNKRRSKYPKDTVILHQIPRGFRCPSLSPFALKLETWLRMAQIPYQNDFGFEFSSKSQIPWITLNGEDKDDSQFCIEFLSKKFDKNLNKNLNDKELALSRCVLKTCEESLKWCMVLHRFIFTKTPNESGIPGWMRFLFKSKIRKTTYNQGYGRHSEEETYTIGKADLKSINDIIGENKFLFGNEPCDVDASLFGMLAQIVYHDLGPLNKYLKSSCPNILRYVETIKMTFWPDWNGNIRDKSHKLN